MRRTLNDDPGLLFPRPLSYFPSPFCPISLHFAPPYAPRAYCNHQHSPYSYASCVVIQVTSSALYFLRRLPPRRLAFYCSRSRKSHRPSLTSDFRNSYISILQYLLFEPPDPHLHRLPDSRRPHPLTPTEIRPSEQLESFHGVQGGRLSVSGPETDTPMHDRQLPTTDA